MLEFRHGLPYRIDHAGLRPAVLAGNGLNGLAHLREAPARRWLGPDDVDRFETRRVDRLPVGKQLLVSLFSAGIGGREIARPASRSRFGTQRARLAHRFACTWGSLQPSKC